MSPRSRLVLYWLATTLLAAELLVGAVFDLFQLPPFFRIVIHLGYPAYLSYILGTWKALGGVALLAPRTPRLKEWVYAGATFNFTGAAASHLAVRDPIGALVAPIVFVAVTLASWALRPAARRDSAPCGAQASEATRDDKSSQNGSEDTPSHPLG